MNRVILTGRVATDPTFNQLQEGESARFRLAVRRLGRAVDGQPVADFFTVVAYGLRVQLVRSHFKKGLLIGVEGRLRSRTFTGNDGVRREVVEIVADNFEFLTPKEEENGHVPPPVATTAAPQRKAQAPEPPADYYPF